MITNMPTRDSPGLPDSDQRVCDIRLLKDSRPVHLARASTRAFLNGLGVLADQVFQIELAVSELATNAHEHASTPQRLRIYLRGRSLWIGICDGDPHTATLVDDLLREGVAPGPLSQRGRGLYLAREACAGQCDVRPLSGEAGKEILLGFQHVLPRSLDPLAA